MAKSFNRIRHNPHPGIFLSSWSRTEPLWITALCRVSPGWDNPAVSKVTVISGPFAAVSNGVLFDPSLSLAAKGLFAYLRAKPNDWSFSCYRIAEEVGVNEKTCRKLVLELEKYGLIRRTKSCTGDIDYEIAFEKPTGKFARQAICPAGNFTAISNKDIYTPETKKEQTGAEAPPPDVSPFDFRETMRRWDEGKDRAFRLMSAYFERKGIVCASKAELEVTRGRHIRAARDVAAFEDSDRIIRAMDACEADKRRGGVDWTLETVKKKLTNGFK